MKRPNTEFKPTKRGLEGVSDLAGKLFYGAFPKIRYTKDEELSKVDGRLVRAGEDGAQTRFWSVCSDQLYLRPMPGFRWITRWQAAKAIEAATNDVIQAIKKTLGFNELNIDTVELELLAGGMKQHVVQLKHGLGVTIWADVGAVGVVGYPPEFSQAPTNETGVNPEEPEPDKSALVEVPEPTPIAFEAPSEALAEAAE